jgi:hypothetical protein
MPITLMSPIQPAIVDQVPLAPRPATLGGKTLGLYCNGKLNAARLLDLIAEELAEDASFSIHRGSYSPSEVMAPEDWGDIDQCDVVILANGDCGACSSSGIANTIEVERRGIPALLISTPPFELACRTMTELGGMPALEWAIVEHPIGSVDGDALRIRAADAARQFRSIMLADESAQWADNRRSASR